jgi:propanediol dehydratase small subunit
MEELLAKAPNYSARFHQVALTPVTAKAQRGCSGIIREAGETAAKGFEKGQSVLVSLPEEKIIHVYYGGQHYGSNSFSLDHFIP